MDFNTSVERIGFTLAVLLYENELPENLWHTATMEQCFAFIRITSESGFFPQDKMGERILDRIGSVRSSDVAVVKAKERVLTILAQADFLTARRWYIQAKYWYDWQTMSFDRMKQTATNFADWRSIVEFFDLRFNEGWRNGAGSKQRDEYRTNRRDLVQRAYPFASTRQDYGFLSLFDGPFYYSPVGRQRSETKGALTARQYVEVAEKILSDNPSDEEWKNLGKRFPEDHAYYAKFLEIELRDTLASKNTWSELCRLYNGFDWPSVHRGVIASTILRELRAGSCDPQCGMFELHSISDLATKYGDQEVADETFQFVVDHTEEIENPGYLQANCEWILNWTTDSEMHRKFKDLAPEKKIKSKYGRGRPRTKPLVEV